MSSDADTVPTTPALSVSARAHNAAAAVDSIVDDARASIPGWDNLAFIHAFVRAAEAAKEALRTSTHAVERRLVGQRLLRLIPATLLPAPLRERTVVLTLPDCVLDRADTDFALRDDDALSVHPSWTAFLLRESLLDDVLQPTRHEWLLAPRSFSPKDALGSAMLVRVIGDGGNTSSSNELVQVEIKNPGGHTSRRRRTSDGKDAGPAELRRDVLHSWLRHAGPSARGLDLRQAADRCLLLTYHATLRERRLDALLSRPAKDSEHRQAVIQALLDAAIDTIAFATLDPLACRFVFPGGEAHHAWVEEAVTALVELGLGAEVMPAQAAVPVREVVWLDALVDAGFVGGAMSDVAQARALARLMTSTLAPLGVLPMVGSRCGRGVIATIIDDDAHSPRQRGPLWVEPARGDDAVIPLWEAWAQGRARILPAPHADTAHDLSSLPTYLHAFSEFSQ